MTNAPGRVLLLVASILYIVFNAVTFFNTPMTLWTIAIWLPDFGGEAMREAWTLIYMADIVIALLAVLVGIAGLALSNKIHKAGLLIGLMIFSMTLAIIYTFIYTAVIFSSSVHVINTINLVVTTWLMSLIGLALSILFIIGAVKNKKAANAAPYEREWR